MKPRFSEEELGQYPIEMSKCIERQVLRDNELVYLSITPGFVTSVKDVADDLPAISWGRVLPKSAWPDRTLPDLPESYAYVQEDIKQSGGSRGCFVYEKLRVVPLGMMPRPTSVVLSPWVTPTGPRRLAFGGAYTSSKSLSTLGGGNLFTFAKCSSIDPSPDADEWVRQPWSFQVGMRFTLDRGGSVAHTKCGTLGQSFVASTKKQPSLVLLGMRTLTYTQTLDRGYLPENALCGATLVEPLQSTRVVMAYVTNEAGLGLAEACKGDADALCGPKGPLVYEIPFDRLLFPEVEYEYTHRTEAILDILTTLKANKAFGAPKDLETAQNQGNLLRPFGGKASNKDTVIHFASKVRFKPFIHSIT